MSDIAKAIAKLRETAGLPYTKLECTAFKALLDCVEALQNTLYVTSGLSLRFNDIAPIYDARDKLEAFAKAVEGT